MRVDIRLSEVGVTGITSKVKAGITRGVARVTAQMTSAAMDAAPRRTGNLKRSIHSEIGTVGEFTGKVIQDVGVAKYGPFVEYGTGIYGPKHERIYPKNAQVLAWTRFGVSRPTSAEGWRNARMGGQAFIARSIAGMRPQPFMRKGFDKVKPNVKQIIMDEIRRAVRGG